MLLLFPLTNASVGVQILEIYLLRSFLFERIPDQLTVATLVMPTKNKSRL